MIQVGEKLPQATFALMTDEANTNQTTNECRNREHDLRHSGRFTKNSA